MKKPRSNKLHSALISTAAIVVGNALLAFTVAAFVVPHDILIGGTTGIGIVVNKLLPMLDMAAVVFVLNLVLLIFGLIVLGKKFFFTTVISSIIYPFFLALFNRIPKIYELCEDPTLAAIFAGVFFGVSLGMVMRVGSSTGGVDVITLVLHKWFHAPVSVFVYVVDFVILLAQVFFFEPRGILLGILVIILESLMIEQTMIFGKSMVQVFVVSEGNEQIRERLLDELDVGVTMAVIETGRLRKEQKGILCVIQPRKVHSTVELIRSVDPDAFVTITKLKEVRGRGFTMERTYLE